MRSDFINLLKSLRVCRRQAWKLLRNICKGIINFITPYEKSVYKAVSPEEFYRIIMLSSMTGGGFSGFIAYIKSHLTEFITDPNLAAGAQAFVKHCDDKHLAAAIFACIFTLEYIRRKFHGDDSK